MNLSNINKKYTFYVWVGLVYVFFYLLNDLVNYPDQFVIRWINHLWASIYVIALNILLFEFTLPWVSWKKIFRSTGLLFVHLMFYSFGAHAWRFIGIQLHIYTPLRIFKTIEEEVQFNFPFAVGSIFFFGIVKHIYDYKKLKEDAQQLRIEKQQSELNYLKSQTNPHFLFNTLNNIYSLARDKSDLAPQSILGLSKILRFMLYETTGEYIAIEQELKIINDYIALEQLRYDDSLRVNFNYDIEDMKQPIPPLLLIPLVENAFKHGVSETRHQPFVDIHLSVKKRELEFIVKNSSEKTYEPVEKMGPAGVRENIGLNNLKRQLELLYTDHELFVHQNDAVFTATIRINLDSHV
jgi:two-component system, LytTR family, sensor kinase